MEIILERVEKTNLRLFKLDKIDQKLDLYIKVQTNFFYVPMLSSGLTKSKPADGFNVFKLVILIFCSEIFWKFSPTLY